MIAKVKYHLKDYRGIISIVCKVTDTKQTILRKARAFLRRSGHEVGSIQSLEIQSRA
ncbi:hypothetical protein MY04_05680 [Flammeovirga sp. MY04]|uniref:hypothetical protein n=1 Tax=Flammeovirga sp. MY04 TaxID=1191459 RepID=UPI001305363D|nr:hypothetical protein [Flammeovirga sp. MY04]MBB3697139.1 hypothetical protein [Flammeovirga yaeyamensis]QJD09391.1 hypothetical protein MY04_05680 [Flammeovirga sp. MY04]